MINIDIIVLMRYKVKQGSFTPIQWAEQEVASSEIMKYMTCMIIPPFILTFFILYVSFGGTSCTITIVVSPQSVSVYSHLWNWSTYMVSCVLLLDEYKIPLV